MEQPAGTSAAPRGGGNFTETHWSMVLRAGHPDVPGAAAALESLCRIYWYPVYAWIRGRGHGPDDAKDLTQEFMASLLKRESLGTVDPDKGRFRTFLIRSIQYLTDEHRQNTAAKRGSGRALVELDALDPEQRYALEPVSEDAPDAAFDRRWSRVLVARAYQRLAEEQTAAGHTATFAALQDFIGSSPEAGDYREAAATLGVQENTVAVTVRRLRLRCRELIMEEIMQTVATRTEAEDELRALFGK